MEYRARASSPFRARKGAYLLVLSARLVLYGKQPVAIKRLFGPLNGPLS